MPTGTCAPAGDLADDARVAGGALLLHRGRRLLAERRVAVAGALPWPDHLGGMRFLVLGGASMIVAACVILYRLCVGSVAVRSCCWRSACRCATRAGCCGRAHEHAGDGRSAVALVHERHRWLPLLMFRVGERARGGGDGDRRPRRRQRGGHPAGSSGGRARSPEGVGARGVHAPCRAGDAADAARFRLVAVHRQLDSALPPEQDLGMAADLARRSVRNHFLGAGAGVSGAAVLAPPPAAAPVSDCPGGSGPAHVVAGHVGARGARHPQHQRLC